MAIKTPKIVKKHQLLNNGLHLNPSKSEVITFFNPRYKPVQTLAESSWVHFCGGSTNQTSDINQESGWVSISTPDYLSTNSYLKHVKRHISTSVPCATFDHLSPLRQLRVLRQNRRDMISCGPSGCKILLRQPDVPAGMH